MDKETLILALLKLDPDNDKHWLKSGLVAMEAIETLLGFDVSRDDLNAMLPDGFDRETCKELLAEYEQMGAEFEFEGPDAIALIEQFVAAVQTDRYRRNSELQMLARQWQVQQTMARKLQDRIDARMKSRAKRAAQAKAVDNH